MRLIKQFYMLAGVVLLMVTQMSFANTDQMNATLARINMILTQVNPLINAAQKEQDPNARVKFQFDRLRADIGKIQTGIAEEINLVSIQPRQVAPLSGDYLPARDVSMKRGSS